MRAIASDAWHPFKRVMFRFACIYMLLYSFPFPLSYLDSVSTFVGEIWNNVAVWVAREMLGITQPLFIGPTGSGDTTANYVILLTMTTTALIGTLIWSLLDRKRKHYTRLGTWLMIGTRYFLGGYMVLYGMVKMFKSQFGEPGLAALVEPFGDMSPMGIVWDFMGYSTPYTFFAGFSEALGGVLLFHRRTQTLGALISVAVMVNVVMLNFCYDVPVKLFSSHLLIMAAAIALQDWRRLLAIFITGKSTEPQTLPPHFQHRAAHIAGRIIKWATVLYLLYTHSMSGYQGLHEWGDKKPKPALYGLYEVTCFQVDEEIQTPIMGDAHYMRRMGIDKWNTWIDALDDTRSSMNFQVDEENTTILVGERGKEDDFWTYTPTENGMILKGFWKGLPFTATMTRKGREDFMLIKRGFHWINEQPYNR